MFPGKVFYEITNAAQARNCLNQIKGNTENY